MSWVRLDDLCPENPKLEQAGAAAGWLWVCGLAYCNRRTRRDGFIPSAKVSQLYLGMPAPMKNAQRLVDAGLWEICDGGYRIHDYLKFQPTAEKVAEVSAKRAAAGKIGGEESGKARSKIEANDEAICFDSDEANGKQTLSEKSNPVPSRPKEEVKTIVPVALDFEALYRRFPRRKGSPGKTKGIERAKAKAKTRAVYDALGLAIDAYAAERKGEDPKFTMQFSRFVNEWEDYAPEPAQTTLAVGADALPSMSSDERDRLEIEQTQREMGYIP